MTNTFLLRFRYQEADLLHNKFLIAAKLDIVPPSAPIDTKGLDLRVKTKRGVTFASPIGLASGLLDSGCGSDSIFSATGFDANTGLSTFVELGPCTPER